MFLGETDEVMMYGRTSQKLTKTFKAKNKSQFTSPKNKQLFGTETS